MISSTIRSKSTKPEYPTQKNKENLIKSDQLISKYPSSILLRKLYIIPLKFPTLFSTTTPPATSKVLELTVSEKSSQLSAIMSEDVLEDAKRCDLQKLEKNKTMLLELTALDILLDDVYESHRPSCRDYDNRRDLIRIFNEMSREIYGNDDRSPVVKEFGSYVMGFFDASSDLDLSINFDDNYENEDRYVQVNTLRKFSKKLYKLQRNRHVSEVQLILSARVPVLKVTDNGSKVECDLSVGNLNGIVKSQIISIISAIDERFKKLSVLMKLWAKANDINSAKDGTINSLSLILLAAFHLQTRDIPILPPFSAILKDGLDLAAVENNVRGFLNYGVKNKESLAELFVSMLMKLESVNELWQNGLCASTYEGSWIFSHLGSISVEDFMDRSQNTCRATKRKKMGIINSQIRDSLKQIRLFTEQKIGAVELKNLLFQAKPKVTVEVVPKAKKKFLQLVNSYFNNGKRKEQEESDQTQSEEKSEILKKICPGNSESAKRQEESGPPQNEEKSEILKPGKSKSPAQGVKESVPVQSKGKSGIPKKICPGNGKSPALKEQQSEQNSGISKKTCREDIKSPFPTSAPNPTPTPTPKGPAHCEEMSGIKKKKCLVNIKPFTPVIVSPLVPIPARTPTLIRAPSVSQPQAPARVAALRALPSTPALNLRYLAPDRAPALALAPQGVAQTRTPTGPNPFDVGSVGTSSSSSTSFRDMNKSQGITLGVCNQLFFPANGFQGSGGARSENRLGIRPESSHGWVYHGAPSFMARPPLPASYTPVQGSTGTPLSFPGIPTQAPPYFQTVQGFSGCRPERAHVDHFGWAPYDPHPLGSRPSSFMPPYQPHLRGGPSRRDISGHSLNRPYDFPFTRS